MAFNKFKNKVDGYLGSVEDDYNNITNKWNDFKSDWGTGSNLDKIGNKIENLFDQRISDGLDDLIHGALGFRTSNIPSIGSDIIDTRIRTRTARQKALTTDAQQNAANTSSDAPEDSPPSHTILRYPGFKSMKTEFGDPVEFPNWIHFRSLKRRHEGIKEDAGSVGSGKISHDTLPETNRLYDIFLHLPDNLADNLQVTYSESEADILSTILNSLFGDKDKNMTGAAAMDMEMVKKQLSAILPGSGLRQMQAGAMINPKKFQTFGGVPFRTFTYAFTFRPKNQGESDELRSIFSAFKTSMLPGVQGAMMGTWTFPNEWAIEFDGLIKDWLDFPLTSVCTGCDIDYTGGQGYASTFDGAPMAVTMNLTFTETVSLNRARFYSEVSAANPKRNSQAREGTNISDDMLISEIKEDSEATVITHNDGTDTKIESAGGNPMYNTMLNK